MISSTKKGENLIVAIVVYYLCWVEWNWRGVGNAHWQYSNQIVSLGFRYLNIYEQIHFLGEDPKTVDTRRDDEGPIRKKHCGPQYNVPLTYNHGQHDVAGKAVCTLV